MGAAVDYLDSIGGLQAVHEHETALGGYLHQELARVEGVSIYGPEPGCEGGRAGLATFNLEGLHATDVSMLLDAAGAISERFWVNLQGWRCSQGTTARSRSNIISNRVNLQGWQCGPGTTARSR